MLRLRSRRNQKRKEEKIMKKIRLKRMITSLITLVALIMCMSISVFAAGADDAKTGTITISNDKDTTHVSISGKTFTLYRFMDATNGGDAAPDAYAYHLSNDFKDFFTSTQFTGAFSTTADLTLQSGINSFINGLSAENLQKFAKAVYDYAKANNIAGTDAVVAAGQESVSVENLPIGYYLVYGVSTANDGATSKADVITACALDTTAYDTASQTYKVTIDIKVGAPTIDKKIVLNKDTVNETLANQTTSQIGDIVDFRVASCTPDVTGYTTYKLEMADTLSKGLTYQADTLKVYYFVTKDADGKDLAIPVKTEMPAANYSAASSKDNATGATSITVTFANIKTAMETYKIEKNTPIYFEYSAIVNNDAVIAPANNPNTAKIIFSNDPYTNSTGETVEKKVYVYTFRLDVEKYYEKGAEKTETPLSGAEFEIYTGTFTALKGTNGPKAENVKLNVTLTNGVYKVATTGTTGAQTKLKSGTDGMIHIDGLDAGTYTLVETKAPDGFNDLEKPINVTIVATESVTDLTGATAPAVTGSISGGGIADSTTIAATPLEDGSGIAVKVENKAGSKLPSTGGMGTKLFYAFGAILMLAAVIGFMVRTIAKRKER